MKISVAMGVCGKKLQRLKAEIDETKRDQVSDFNYLGIVT
jgi:hypothetical protein